MGTKQSAMIKHWDEEATALKPEQIGIGVPVYVLLGEGVDAAKFHGKYWHTEVDPRTKVVRRLGLDSTVPKKPRANDLSAHTGAEIVSLVDAVQHAQTEYLLTTGGHTGDGALDRAHFINNEIESTLEWLFDDGIEDANDQQFAQLMSAHANDPDTRDAVASHLADNIGLAEKHRTEIDGLAGFDISLLDEGAGLVTLLREGRSAPAPHVEGNSDTAKALERRNRLATILSIRIARVRKAARTVFRHEPQIVRESTSTYERNKRAAARRAAHKKAATQPDAATAPKA